MEWWWLPHLPDGFDRRIKRGHPCKIVSETPKFAGQLVLFLGLTWERASSRSIKRHLLLYMHKHLMSQGRDFNWIMIICVSLKSILFIPHISAKKTIHSFVCSLNSILFPNLALLLALQLTSLWLCHSRKQTLETTPVNARWPWLLPVFVSLSEPLLST